MASAVHSSLFKERRKTACKAGEEVRSTPYPVAGGVLTFRRYAALPLL